MSALRVLVVLLVVVCHLVLATCARAAVEQWPAGEWRVGSPESQGVDSRPLADAIALAVTERLPIHGLLIVRHGVLVLESYFYPYEPSVPHDLASVTKSVTSILTGIAVDKGYLQSAAQPALALLARGPLPGNDPRKHRITIAHLLSMTSGLECGPLNAALPAEPELVAMRQTTDWIGYGLELPMRLEPGSRFAYCSVNNHLLSGIVTRQTGQSLLEFGRAQLFEPLGIRDVRWPVGSAGLNHGWADLHLLPRDMAKLGYLYLRGGRWENRQIVSQAWIDESFVSRTKVTPGVEYGYSWWINTQREPHILEAVGRGGQRISLVPDKQAVVVFLGGGVDTRRLAPFILDALRSDSPLPENPQATARLAEWVARARRGPERSPTSGVLPAAAAAVSGTTFRFASNPIDLRSATLSFAAPRAAQFEIRIGEETWHGPVGLDGVYEFSPSGHQSLPLGARGKWVSPSTFELEVDLIANITRLTFTFAFDRHGADVHVTDATGSIDALDLTAVPEPLTSPSGGRSIVGRSESRVVRAGLKGGRAPAGGADCVSAGDGDGASRAGRRRGDCQRPSGARRVP